MSRRGRFARVIVVASLTITAFVAVAAIESASAQECRDPIDPILGAIEQLVEQARLFPDDSNVKAALEALDRAESAYEASRARVQTNQQKLAAAQAKSAGDIAAANRVVGEAAVAQAQAAAAGGGNASLNKAAAQAATEGAKALIKTRESQQSVANRELAVQRAQTTLAKDAEKVISAKKALDDAVQKAKQEHGEGQEKALEHGSRIVPCPRTGLYVGVHIGGGIGDSMWDEPTGGTGRFAVAGPVGGVMAGFDQRYGNWMAGLEADLAVSDIRGDTRENCASPCRTSNSVLATVRGRVGYPIGDYLPYVSAGAAFGNISVTMKAYRA